MEMEDFTPRKKTQVADIERTIYDITNEDRSAYKSQSGLTENYQDRKSVV